MVSPMVRASSYGGKGTDSLYYGHEKGYGKVEPWLVIRPRSETEAQSEIRL